MIAKKMIGVVSGVVLLGATLSLASNRLEILMEMREPFYIPPYGSVFVGQSIEWVNRSEQPHTITYDGCVRDQTCFFASGVVHPGERFAVTSLPPGHYPYHCSIHPFMRGMLEVKERAAPPSVSTEL